MSINGEKAKNLCWLCGKTNMKKVVFITGASSGIGKALAEIYSQKGHMLALFDRRQPELQKVSSSLGALAIVGDVTSKDDLERAINETLAKYGRLDLYIANAGFGVVGDSQKLSTIDYRRQFETNVFAVVEGYYSCIKALRRSKGHFAVTGSIYSFVTTSGSVAYCMSKYAIRAFIEGIRYEVEQFGVQSTLVAPGFVQTQIRQVNNKGQFIANAKEQIPNIFMLSASSAAKIIYRGLEARRGEIVVSLHAKLIHFVSFKCRWLLNISIKILGKKIANRVEIKETTSREHVYVDQGPQ